MRRRAWAVTAALGAVLLAVTMALPVTAASAAPPIPLPSPSPGTSACTVDKDLGGITGLAVTSTGYAVTVKSQPGLNVKVYQLDNACKLRSGKALAYPSGARDPQDIQVAADGALWVADTGDNVTNPARTSIAVWKFAPDGRATLYRFSYPVKAQAAEALLINGDGTPIIITDNPNGPAGIYVPTGPLDPTGRVVPLKSAGTFTPQVTGTENKLGPIGMARVTGAANSHDGKHVAIRTFSDAYEWAVTNGDVVSALTTGTPKITPLPNEPQGTAIAYSRDGASFLTVSDNPVGTQTPMLKYHVSPPPVAATKAPAAPAITGKGDTRSWFSKLNLQDLLRIVGGIGVVGLLMVVGGIVGIRRARRRARLAAANARRQPPPQDESDLVNQSTAALAQVSGGRRADRYENDRYGTDRYDDTDRYDASLQYPPADRPPAAIPEPPFGGGGGGGGYPDRGYGYPPPDEPDRYAAPPRPPAGPPSPGPRGDRGVARSHRPSGRRGPRDNGDQLRGGYSNQHDGFGDILE